LFDGPHRGQDQYDALKFVLPALDDEFILIVDDWNDPRPRDGTLKAFDELAVEKLYSMEIRTSDGAKVINPKPFVQERSHWSNGNYIVVCRKTNESGTTTE